MRKLSRLGQVLSQVFLFFVGLYVIIPIWGMLRLAFDGSLLSRPTEFRLFPKVFSIQPLFEVLDRPYQSVQFVTLFKNSMVVSLGAALLAIILGASLAYAFARFRFPGRPSRIVPTSFDCDHPSHCICHPFVYCAEHSQAAYNADGFGDRLCCFRHSILYLEFTRCLSICSP